jgi:uncharacterized damage-inducible protein DinB
VNAAYFRELFAYNYWRNHKILARARDVQPWQIDAPTTYPFVSLRGTLVHTLGVEWMWFQRLTKNVSPTALWAPSDFPTLGSVEARWASEQALWLDFIAGLTDEACLRDKTYTLLNGGTVTDKLWMALDHVVNHGTQHCAEMAQMLTDCGKSPGNIDFIYYLREKK